MQSLLLSFNLVAPMFFLMMTGMLLRRLGIINEAGISQINKLVSNLLIPATILNNMISGDLHNRIDWALFGFVLGGITLNFILYSVAVPRLAREDKRRAVVIHTVTRGNTAIYGIPLVQALIGDGNTTELMVLLSLSIVYANILAITALERYCGKENNKKRGVFFRALLTPIVLSGMLGLVLVLLRVRLPSIILTPINSLSAASMPVAFMALGASFRFDISRENRRCIAAMSVSRLIVTPLVWLAVGICIVGFRGSAVVALLAVFATPPAVSSFSLCDAYGADSRLASEVVVCLTGISIFTLFFLIAGLNYFGLV